MLYLGEHWTKWELEKVYSKKQPKWTYLLGILSLIIVIITWYNVFNLNIEYSWIISLLITFTLIKVFILIFNYKAFRKFAETVLCNHNNLVHLNIFVFIISVIFEHILENYTIAILITGLILIHVAAVNNGFKMYGKINVKHHMVRLIISILIIALFIIK